jgi:hypothetical protein
LSNDYFLTDAPSGDNLRIAAPDNCSGEEVISMTITITKVERIEATRIHADPEAGGV